MGKVNATPALLNEKFGCSASIDGDWMAVGASESTVGIARATGAVHLFKNTDGTWVYKQSLFQENPLIFQAFGNAVSLRGDTLAVGSWGSSSFAGRAFVYTRGGNDNWTLVATLDPSDPQPSKPALFGWSVSLDTPTGLPPVIAIGRPNDGTTSKGAVYMFEFDGTAWTQVAKLQAAVGATGDQLGTNVSVCNGTLVAGISRRRRAMVFQRESGVWAYKTELQDSNSVASDGFGSSVCSGGTFIGVGSPNRISEAGATKAGAATVFQWQTSEWKQVTLLTLASPQTGENFGYAMAAAVTGPDGLPLIAISAPGYDAAMKDSGAAFAFSLTAEGWTGASTDLWSPLAIQGQFSGKTMSASRDGLLVALSSELPRGSIGGVFPMQFLPSAGGSSAGSAGGSSSSESSGTGGSGGSSSGGDSGGDDSGSDGAGSDPSTSIGSGGRPRPLQPLPALPASFGQVTDTIILDHGSQLSVVGLLTDGVQRFAGPEVEVLATYPSTWSLRATGDVNGDASGDFIWQDDTKNVRTWVRDGTTFLSKNTLRVLGPAETIVASVDFDGDGVDDVVTRDAATTSLNVLRMRDGVPTTEFVVPLPSLEWHAVPHHLDGGILIRNSVNGNVRRVSRNPVTGAITSAEAPSPDADTAIEGTGDVDGDGNLDMVCRNPGTDELSIWRLDIHGDLIQARDTGIDGSAWKVEAVRDWDNNGCDDLLVSRGGSGRLVVLYMHFEQGVPKILKSRLIGNTGGSRIVDVTKR